MTNLPLGWLRTFVGGVRAPWRKKQVEHDLDEELRGYLDMAEAAKSAAGMTPDQARRATRLDTGGLDAIKDHVRTAAWESVVEAAWQDLRVGARRLRANPGFTIVAVLTLAIGIGANTAIFSFVRGTLLRPLAFQDPQRLALLWETSVRAFERMATFTSARLALSGPGDPQFVAAGVVSTDFFDVLKVAPARGRAFRPEEGEAGANHVALLTDALWRQRFGSDQAVLGRPLRLEGVPYTIVGVLPPFEFGVPGYYPPQDVWIPAVIPRGDSGRGHHYLNVIVRLKGGVTLQQAQQDADRLSARIAEMSHPKVPPHALLVGLHDAIVGDARPVLLILFGAVGVLLLIACVNVANLQLARGSVRQKEIALRAALGASRARIVRQFVTESLLLAACGGALGILFAMAGTSLLVRAAVVPTPYSVPATTDLAVLAYLLGVSIVTGIAFGLAPALHGSAASLGAPLHDGGRTTTATGTGGLRLRSLLMVCQVALSMVLLIGAGLLIHSFTRLLDVKPGFDIDHILTMRIDLPKFAFPKAAGQSAFYRQLLERVRALPGAAAVGATNDLPLTGGEDSDTVSVEGRVDLDQSTASLAIQDRVATTDYFRAMGIPIVAGRAFTDADTDAAPPVALVNRSLARRLFADGEAVGKRLKFGDADSSSPWLTIVGIVGDVRGFGLDQRPHSEVYVPYEQASLPYNPLPRLHLVVRTAGDPAETAAALRSAIRELNRNVPLPAATTMRGVYAASLADRRAYMLLLGVFAAIAITLVAVGMYGVISYSVARRTHELGVRMALGARTRDVIRLVVGQGLALTGLGVAIGLALALPLARLLSTMVYEMGTTDPATYVGVALLLAAVALAASYVPARRATKVDPTVALRCE